MAEFRISKECAEVVKCAPRKRKLDEWKKDDSKKSKSNTTRNRFVFFFLHRT